MEYGFWPCPCCWVFIDNFSKNVITRSLDDKYLGGVAYISDRIIRIQFSDKCKSSNIRLNGSNSLEGSSWGKKECEV